MCILHSPVCTLLIQSDERGQPAVVYSLKPTLSPSSERGASIRKVLRWSHGKQLFVGLVLVRDGVAVCQSGCVSSLMCDPSCFNYLLSLYISVMPLWAEECCCTVLCVG